LPPLRILIAEDSDEIREVLALLLLADQHLVTLAQDGERALELFVLDRARSDVRPFDLVITDRAMPRLNGDQLAAAIKQLEPGVPVLMVTGFGDSMIAGGAAPAGVDLVVGKPLTGRQLRQAIQRLLSGQAAA